MDEADFQEVVERLKRANEVIADLDPAIRADAFKLLRSYVATGADLEDDDEGDDEEEVEETPKPRRRAGALDEDALIEEHESDRESENALLALAISYARYGKGPFKMTALSNVAKEKNLDIPNRADMFFKGHKRDGKEVIRKQADGWKITPSGETWLKATYGVTKGKRTASDEES